METIKKYQENQQQIINKLNILLDYLTAGEEFGVKLDNNLKDKIHTAIEKTKQDKLKVALIGGFSEGKTSIAAAWVENYDKSTMQISALESTNDVKIYNVEEDLVLIDTPGLFGFKETQDKEKYKDITKKYVSEADLILYVMGPTNPIKNSHREELIWLFKELNLLDRTVFVISRFDEEADVEDEEDYLDRFLIKKENIIQRLKDFEIIENDENIDVVAVAADPFEQGINYWLDNLDEYKKISHIPLLQQATTEKIAKCGGRNKILLDTQQSIVRYVMSNAIPEAEEKIDIIEYEANCLRNVYDEVKDEYNALDETMRNTRIRLRNFIIDYFTDLILQVKGLSLETIDEFYIRNIGESGMNIERDINNKFESEVGVVLNNIKNCESSLNTSVIHYNNVLGELSKEGLKCGGELLKNGALKIDGQKVLAIRDLLFKNVKFKPWGATKLAKNLTKAAAIAGVVIGVALDVWEAYSEKKKHEEVEKKKEEMIKHLEGQKREYVKFIDNDEEYRNLFNPNYDNLTSQINSVLFEINDKEDLRKRFDEWKKNIDIIDVEFRVLD